MKYLLALIGIVAVGFAVKTPSIRTSLAAAYTVASHEASSAYTDIREDGFKAAVTARAHAWVRLGAHKTLDKTLDSAGY